MHQRIYAFGFGIVAVSVIVEVLTKLATLVGLPEHHPLLGLSFLFSQPIPPVFNFFPRLVAFILQWAFVALIFRRLWLCYEMRSLAAPASFARTAYVLTYVSVISVLLSIVGFALSIALDVGSGVPVGLLIFPAVVLLAPVIAWVELRSLSFKRGASPNLAVTLDRQRRD